MHVIDALTVGGSERMLVDIANSSAEAGHQVSACVTRLGRELAGALRPEIPLWELGRQRRFDWSAMRWFARIVRDQRVDVLHAHGRSTFAFLSLAKAQGLLSPPIVVHDHWGDIEYDMSVPFGFRWGAKRWAAQYVGVCPKLGLWAEQIGLPRERISVIQNALDFRRLNQAEPADIRSEFGLGADVPVGIVVAGQRFAKGTDLLLTAIALCARGRAAKYLIVGAAQEQAFFQACQAKLAGLGLSETVFFLGVRSDVPSLIKSADFALIASRTEAGPLVLIEYLASDLPVVYTRVGGIASQVAELGVPGAVAPGDAAALATALNELLQLPANARIARGKVGGNVAREHFDIQGHMPEWYRVYSSALDAQPK